MLAVYTRLRFAKGTFAQETVSTYRTGVSDRLLRRFGFKQSSVFVRHRTFTSRVLPLGMSGRDSVDDTSFYLDYETQVDATRDAVSKLAREVLQYEWADYLESYPPSGSQAWEYYDVGKPWARVAPNAWEAGQSRGFDLHFEHFPTPRALERGWFRLELHLEDGVHGDADFSAGSPYAALREHLIERIDGDEMEARPDGEFGHGKTIWCAEYRFVAGDTRAYYETLRTALEEHDELVATVTDVLLDETADER